MAKTHYDTLGVKRAASEAEIRSAYRKLVLRHHPDHSSDPKSREVFLQATEAYETLSDAPRRTAYDSRLDDDARRAAERVRANVSGTPPPPRPAGPRPSAPPPGWRSDSPPTHVAADVQRLTSLFSQGRHAEADRLARQISESEPRHPVPYAILGDLARMRGDVNEAARLYAYAAQFDPTNGIYLKRYEDLLKSSQVTQNRRNQTRLAAQDQKLLAPMVGGGVVVCAACYLALGRESSLLSIMPPVASWTLGTLVMLFLSGVAVGASMATGNLLDRFQSMTASVGGRLSPNVALGLVAAVNFWAAALLYVCLGAFQRAFNFSTNRLVIGVGLTTFALAIGAAVSPNINPMQIVLWGGNLAYFGALVGWMVADAFRP